MEQTARQLDAPALLGLDLEALEDATWMLLEDGVTHSDTPFHTPVLATQNALGPELRTVVLRGVDRANRALRCHTDVRSPKIGQMRQGSAVSWLVYDPARKVQVRINGNAILHHRDAVAEASWRAASARSRVCYAAANGPGDPLADPLPERKAAADGFDRFVVVRCRVERLETLVLAASGHRRARWCWHAGQRIATWVAP